MSEQPTALRLADALLKYLGGNTASQAAAELRRLHEANEAFGKRQEWWNERMFVLEQQRDALLLLLGSIRGWDVLDATADGAYWKREIDSAIKAAKENR